MLYGKRYFIECKEIVSDASTKKIKMIVFYKCSAKLKWLKQVRQNPIQFYLTLSEASNCISVNDEFTPELKKKYYKQDNVRLFW